MECLFPFLGWLLLIFVGDGKFFRVLFPCSPELMLIIRSEQ